MKKYYFVLLTAGLLLSGCESSGSSREFVEFDPPHLTTMTMTTTVPVDTYSEYMATYTPTESETTNSNMFYYQGGAAVYGVSADTMATFPSISQVSGVTADTPMATSVPDETGSGADSEPTETVTTEVPQIDEPLETVTATVQAIEAVPVDTVFTDTISALPQSVNTVSSVTAHTDPVSVQSQPVNTVPTVTAVSSARTVPTVSADTAFSNNITGHTGTVPTAAPDTMFKNTSNGGSDNADQHT